MWQDIFSALFSKSVLRKITKTDFPGMAWNDSRMVRNGLEWLGMVGNGPVSPYIFPNIPNIPYISSIYSLRGDLRGSLYIPHSYPLKGGSMVF